MNTKEKFDDVCLDTPDTLYTEEDGMSSMVLDGLYDACGFLFG